jgi:acyl-CoA synthetase (AMP-forming)/AMP-acid ligase II
MELHQVPVEACVDIGVDGPVNLFALLEQTAQRFPDRGAVYHGVRRCCTWSELRDRTNIYPREVEEALLEHPGVLEACVVGAPDAEWGEVVVAFIVGAAQPDELDAHLLQRIARFKRPKRYLTVEQLPKNSYGKVLKRELRQQLM